MWHEMYEVGVSGPSEMFTTRRALVFPGGRGMGGRREMFSQQSTNLA